MYRNVYSRDMTVHCLNEASKILPLTQNDFARQSNEGKSSELPNNNDCSKIYYLQKRLSLRNILAITSILLCTTTVHAKTASEIFEAVSPSIVIVKAVDSEGKVFSFGSGVALSDGVVATSCHVIDKAVSLKVLYRGIEHPASQNKTDRERDVCTLAAIGLHAPGAFLGTTSRLKIGQRVYAVGAPKGLELTLSDGIVSNLRQVQGGQYLQITAPISPGSSGGGLFDDEGRLIGLPTFYLNDGQQLNFAVPVEWIKELSQRKSSVSQKVSRGSTSPRGSQPSINWLNKAIVLEQTKNLHDFLDHVLRWIKTEPKNPVAWLGLGNAYAKLNQKEKSIEAYQQAVRINPDFAEAWYGLGNIYAQLKQSDKAIEAQQQAIRINPDYAAAWSSLGIIYANIKQYDKSLEALRQVVRINPDDGDAWYRLGVVSMRPRPNAKAIVAFQQAIRINPEDAAAWSALGVIYKFSGQTGKAIEVYKRLKSIDPTRADVFFNEVLKL